MITHHITPGRQLILETPGEYSMETAVAILRWLAARGDCRIVDDGWHRTGYGNLVEVGIEVRLNSSVFRVLCSHADILIDRVSGSEGEFITVCEEIQSLEFETI